MRRWLGWLLLGGISLLAVPARAIISDPAFVETKIGSLPALTSMAWAPDGSERLFLTTKTGEVRVMQAGVLLPDPFATLAPIYLGSECGLLGLAFDPNFAQNGYVYVFVTVSATEQQIVRFRADGNVGVEKTVILAGLPTHGVNHDGGALGFGPDGKLYWAIGDNGKPRMGVDADLTSLAAKVGRANPDGSVPGDNPFFDGAGPNNDYIWARGFRNPFTLTFQPATGRLWLNVVGTRQEQVFTPQAGDNGGWDNYEANQPSGFLPPVIAYDTDLVVPRDIVVGGAVRAAGVVTITTSTAHLLRPGARVTIAGVSDASFNTTAFISAADASSFSFAQVGPDAVSGLGTATPDKVGGCIAGGTFWDSSAAPAGYRGNFFFGDYNAAALMRVTLDAQNRVTSVTPWASAITRPIDMAVGPDGDLYYGSYTGALFHARYANAAQALIVSRLNLRLAEGGQAAFNVRLTVAPPVTRSVSVQYRSGDTDVSVLEGAALTFTSADWDVPQRVVIAAAQDVDAIDDSAIVRVSSSGLTNENVSVKVTDDETYAIVVSPSSLTVEEGAAQELAVSLTRPPVGSVKLTLARSSGDASVTVTNGSSLTFTASNWSAPQLALVSAAEDADADNAFAKVTITGAGLTARDVDVTVVDNEQKAPTFSSLPPTTAVVGATYQYDAEAEGLPLPSFSLDAAPAGMTLDPASGLVTWTPMAEQTAPITLRAENGVSPDALQAFDLVVLADQAPTCSLTAPSAGDVLAGIDAEFFGDVNDDVGATRAEFLIDDAVVYDDVNDQGHYHYGGMHALFDTTLLEDGEHRLALRGYDTSGQSCLAEVTIQIDNVPDQTGAGGDAASGAAGERPVSSAGADPGEPAGAAGGERGSDASGAPGSLVPGGQGGESAAGATASSHASDGCSCRSASGGDAGGSWLAFGGLLAVAGMRRPRRRRRLP